MIRVLLADDHQVVRAGLKELLSGAGDIEVAGEATDGHETLERVRADDYDVAVLDMSMPGRSGIELIRLVKAEKPRLRILMLSMHSEQQWAVRALRAGIIEILDKPLRAGDLREALGRAFAVSG